MRHVALTDLAYYHCLNKHKDVKVIADTPIEVMPFEVEREPDDKGMWRWSFVLMMIVAALAALVIAPLRKIFRR